MLRYAPAAAQGPSTAPPRPRSSCARPSRRSASASARARHSRYAPAMPAQAHRLFAAAERAPGARVHAEFGAEGAGEVREVLEAHLIGDGGHAVPRVEEAAGRVGEAKPQEELMGARTHRRLEGAQEAERAQLRLAGEARDGVRLVWLGRNAPRRRRGAGEVARADLRQRRLAVGA